jgi:cytochrome c peroxidase
LYKTDLDDGDTDDDDLGDKEEVIVDFEGTDPTDPLDPDTDDDGMPDGFEVFNSLNPHADDSGQDPDFDGLHNYGEYRLGGNPRSSGSPTRSSEINESFEAGLQSTWKIPEGFAGWQLESGSAADGSYSLVSSTIDDSSSAAITFPLFVNDSILRLQYFVAAANGDFFQVFLDGNLQFEVDGISEWTQSVDIPLLAGFHELRFVYSKNDFGEQGCDCARIDLIHVNEFPLDLDGDGMPGAWEAQYGLDRNDPSDAEGDLDGDQLSNILEFQNNTDPTKRDTDGDWLSDKYEISVAGTDPNLIDTDSDQISDYAELVGGSDPNLPDWPLVREPAENPATEAKRVLGKILFWEEQLSADDTVACGTCHIPSAAGGDPRIAEAHPGPDGVIGTEDDILGSPGIVHRDAAGEPVNDPLFGFARQVTRRNSPSIYTAMFGNELFLDGRAGATFVDPQNQSVVLMASNAALETQAIEPILSTVEMGNEGRTWADVIAKLENVTPLDLASSIPPDMAAAIASAGNYANLFSAAFGDPAITAARIAMAIATYERSLVADRTPWDFYMAGDTDAMSETQIRGWELLRDETACTNCHKPPLFTDNLYWNIGVRPAADDAGRMEVTSSGFDYGRFKTPSLRNVGLRASLMHNGRVFDVKDAIDFYMANHHANRHTQYAEFKTGIPIAGGEITDDYSGAHVHMTTADGEPLQMPVLEFLNSGLTDPRVANETYPFDRPRLGSEPPETDGDGDGISDDWEIAHGLDPLDAADASLDGDSDRLSNLDEFLNATDPDDADSDGDWLKDGLEVLFFGTNPLASDTDGDTMPDFWEAFYWLDVLSPANTSGNPDGDAYTNLQEYQNGTNPRLFDSP